MSYTYDDNGNTLTETVGSSITTYTWDAKNKLTQVDKGGVISTYAYNVDGIRIAQTVGSDLTQFVVDSHRDYAQVIAELDASDAILVHYTYGDDLISQERAGTTSYYHYDGLGSTRVLSDELGEVSDSYDYKAFGEVLNSTGETENSYLYTGEHFDANLGQYYLRARYYDQGVGRFTQQDTWMGRDNEPVTLNKYLYGHSDPVSNVDPTGYFSLSSLSVGMNGSVQLGGRLIGSSALRGFVNKAVRGSIQSVRSTGKLAIKTARQCLRKNDRCKMDIPMLVVGADNRAVAQHILDAQSGRGSNSVGGTLTLNYKASARAASSSKRSWYKNKPECNGFARYRAAAKYNTPNVDCDEYPMFSTYQGGEFNYPGRTSLRPLPRSQNRSVGALAQWLYRSFKFKNRQMFLVIASPDIPVSAWIPAK